MLNEIKSRFFSRTEFRIKDIKSSFQKQEIDEAEEPTQTSNKNPYMLLQNIWKRCFFLKDMP